MLISFSVQVPPAATLFQFGFGIDLPCVRRRIKLEVWTSHVSVHNRILLDLLVLMVSLFFVLLNIGAWWTNWWANPSQLAALQWFYVLMTGMWTCSISEAYFIFPWRIRQRNAPEKNGRRKFGRTIYSIFGTVPSHYLTVEVDTWCPSRPHEMGMTTRFLRYLSFLCQTSDSNNHYGVTNATHQQLLKREDKNLNIKGKVIRVRSAEQPWVLRRLTANKSVNCS